MPGPDPLDACDIAVIGGGPAALALAGVIHERAPTADLRIFCAQSLGALHFENNYGAFANAIPATYRKAAKHTYPETHIAFADAPLRVLDAPYLRFDNNKLIAQLLARLAQVKASPARVEHLVRTDTGFDLYTDADSVVHARLVIDASGSQTPLLRRHAAAAAPLLQRAYGHIVRSERPLFPDAMRLMDFTPAPPPARGDPAQAPPRPTFSYAMPLERDVGGAHQVFVEETQLTGPDATDFTCLSSALARRLAALSQTHGTDIRIVENTFVERCHIVMNTPLPLFDQNLLGFGAAASFVNPATGYSLATLLRRAERAGAAIAAWHHTPHTSRPPPYTLWSSIWTEDEVHAHDFYTKGGAIIATFGQKDLIAFFTAFFRLDDESCFRFLNRDMTRAELFRCGFAMARHMPFGLKARFLSRFAKETARMTRSAPTRRA